MDRNNPVCLEFRVDGKIYAEKRWHHVPRKGDRVIMRDRKVLKVEEVYWADAGDTESIHDCWVQLVCKVIGDL